MEKRQGVSLIFSGKPGMSGLKEQQNFLLGKVKRCETQFWDPAGDVWLEWLRLEPGWSRAYLLGASRHQMKGHL